MSTRTLARFARRHSPVHPRPQLLGDPNRRLLQPPTANPTDVIAAPVPGVLPDPAATSAPAASVLHQATVTLDTTQILALPHASVLVVPSPGADRVILPGVTAWIHAGEWTAVTNINATGYAVFADVDDNQEIGQYFIGDSVGQFVSGGSTSAPYGSVRVGSGPTSDVISVLVNESVDRLIDEALYFYVDNDGAGDFQGGGGAGQTLVIVLEFRVFDVLARRFLTTLESRWDEDAQAFG